MKDIWRQAVFMDFEASAARDGFPVEVGWAWVEDTTVRTEAMLIEPADEWLTPAFTWDPLAESIHGLSLSRLQAEGFPASHVCRVLNQKLSDRVVFFDTGPDGPDRYWMDILFSESCDARGFRIGGPAGELLKAIADDLNVPADLQAKVRERAPPITHQAAEDAAHYAWRAGAIMHLGRSGNVEDLGAKMKLLSSRR